MPKYRHARRPVGVDLHSFNIHILASSTHAFGNFGVLDIIRYKLKNRFGLREEYRIKCGSLACVLLLGSVHRRHFRTWNAIGSRIEN